MSVSRRFCCREVVSTGPDRAHRPAGGPAPTKRKLIGGFRNGYYSTRPNGTRLDNCALRPVRPEPGAVVFPNLDGGRIRNATFLAFGPGASKTAASGTGASTR